MDFNDLGINIKKAHDVLQIQAGKAVNSFLTARNWIVGFYIVEYQQNGKDRANYGDNLILDLANAINIKGLSTTNLKLSRQFYIMYPLLNKVVSDFSLNKQLELPIDLAISQSATDQLQIKKSQSATDQLQIELSVFLNNVSFTHIAELIKIEEPLKRLFYEIQIIKNSLSVNEFNYT